MSEIQIICDRVGRKAISDAVGVSKAAVTNALSDGRFPASWYPAVKCVCDRAGVGCEMRLFSWKFAAPPSQSGGQA